MEDSKTTDKNNKLTEVTKNPKSVDNESDTILSILRDLPSLSPEFPTLIIPEKDQVFTPEPIVQPEPQPKNKFPELPIPIQDTIYNTRYNLTDLKDFLEITSPEITPVNFSGLEYHFDDKYCIVTNSAKDPNDPINDTIFPIPLLIKNLDSKDSFSDIKLCSDDADILKDTERSMMRSRKRKRKHCYKVTFKITRHEVINKVSHLVIVMIASFSLTDRDFTEFSPK